MARPTRADAVRAALLADLEGGALGPGDKLPNEERLAARFEVSRATVREAVGGLVAAGRLRRRHGAGTFVADADAEPARHVLDATVSYTALIRAAGHEPGERVVARRARAATPAEREQLGLPAGEGVVEIERVRLASGRPVVFSRDRLPERVAAEIPPAQLEASLYAALEDRGLRVDRAAARLEPTVADAALAALLDVAPGTPLLHLDQVDRTAGGRAVLLSLEWHVPGVFELIVHRRGG